jgi:hypothetical protein
MQLRCGAKEKREENAKTSRAKVSTDQSELIRGRIEMDLNGGLQRKREGGRGPDHGSK